MLVSSFLAFVQIGNWRTEWFNGSLILIWHSWLVKKQWSPDPQSHSTSMTPVVKEIQFLIIMNINEEFKKHDLVMMMRTERKNKRLTNYLIRFGREKIHWGNGKSLVNFVNVGNIFPSDFLYIYLIINRVVSIKIALLTLQSVQHGKTEL